MAARLPSERVRFLRSWANASALRSAFEICCQQKAPGSIFQQGTLRQRKQLRRVFTDFMTFPSNLSFFSKEKKKCLHHHHCNYRELFHRYCSVSSTRVCSCKLNSPAHLSAVLTRVQMHSNCNKPLCGVSQRCTVN